MGYCMSLNDAKFSILAKNKDAALAAIKALATQTSKMYGQDGDRKFSWVETSNFLDAKTFAEAMDAWRWDVAQDEHGNVISIEFNGTKLGDDLTLFKAIAPYVTSGSYIEMHGEDGGWWRWCFDGAKCSETWSRLIK
jgi:hypothetical protein